MLPPLYSLLSQPWAGMAVGAGIAVIGFLLAVGLRRLQPEPRSGWSRAGTLVVLGAGASSAILLWGGITSFVGISRLTLDHPPPGALVDGGGYRMHILAEGDARGGPTVIWIPGGHGQGLALYHLHAAIRDETRSILFDRPGTGWSDAGPFPRRTALEAGELAELLEGAGEAGPFVLAGHSYGGLLAANFARRHPDRTAALVLLDASPPDAFIYAPAYGVPALEELVKDAERQGLAKVFGGWTDPGDALAEADTVIGEIVRQPAPTARRGGRCLRCEPQARGVILRRGLNLPRVRRGRGLGHGPRPDGVRRRARRHAGPGRDPG